MSGGGAGSAQVVLGSDTGTSTQWLPYYTFSPPLHTGSRSLIPKLLLPSACPLLPSSSLLWVGWSGQCALLVTMHFIFGKENHAQTNTSYKELITGEKNIIFTQN